MPARIAGKAGDGRHRDQEDDRQADEQDGERNLVRRLLPLCAFDERNHAVEKALSELLRHLDLDMIGDDPRACRHGRTVAARLANDGCALTGNRGLVDRGNAFDHLAIGRDEITGFDEDDVAALQLRCRDRLAIGQLRDQLGLGGAQRRCLGAAAPFGERLGEGAEQHGQPQPDNELDLEAERKLLAARDEQHGQKQRDHGSGEEHGVLHQFARVQLPERVADRRADKLCGKNG